MTRAEKIEQSLRELMYLADPQDMERESHQRAAEALALPSENPMRGVGDDSTRDCHTPT